jgi:uncharacterized protein (DUF2225 family)
LSQMLYRKSAYYYRRAIEMEENGTQAFSTAGNLGPDQDNNFGFDGVQYLASILEYKYGSRINKQARHTSLQAVKLILSRVVGMGRSSKEKPSFILEKAREYYDLMKAEIEQLEQDGIQPQSIA